MSEIPEPSDPEDVKIVTLAKAALARAGAGQGACVRDTDGRTYAAVNVALPNLRLSAIAVAVSMAVSSGANGLEAVALAGTEGPSDSDLAVIRDLKGSGVAVWCTDSAGIVQRLIEVRGVAEEDLDIGVEVDD